MLRYYKLWLSLGWLLVFALCYLSLTSSPPSFNIEFEYIDKAGHFIAYFILMFWFAQLYKTPRARLFYVLFFIIMGIMLEVLQGLGGVRFFEYNDILANTLGVTLGWLITRRHLDSIFLFIEKTLIR